ncbi:MAG TPA: hypothetical protein VD846_13950 [Allosphingosinicella sp.]|nr:hypothetical protein [Allosphingosinicella sp.]
MPATTFGIEAVRDPQLVFQMRRGRTVRPPLEARILAYMERSEADPRASRRLGRRK